MSGVKIHLRGNIIFGLFVVVLLLGGLGFWAATADIAGAIIASGKIEVEENRQVVQHPDGGVVEKINVKEGDVVAAGDILVELDASNLQSEFAIVEVRLFETMARRARLQAERDDAAAPRFDAELIEAAEINSEVRSLLEGQGRLFSVRRTSLEEEVLQMSKRSRQVSDQITGINAQLDALAQQLVLIRKEKTDQKTLLDRGLAQASRVLALEREEARLSGSVGELIARRSQAEGRITEFDLAILASKTTRREVAITQLRDLEYQELEMSERRRALQQQLERLDIRAPVSGVVYDLKVFARKSVIRAADEILFLVPQDRPLVISAQVPTMHVDQIHLFQSASLRFASFSQRTTPELLGTVVKISADAFQDEMTGVPYYKVEMTLNDGELVKLPEGAILVPGMPVDAFLRTTDHTLIEYLAKPFIEYFNKAFREP